MEPIAKTKRMAWIIFAVLSLPYLLVYFQRVAPAVVADRLMADFNISGAVLGNLAAIYFYIYTVMQVPAGLLADSLGPKRTIALGSVISSVGSILFGFAPGITVAYLGRFLVGLGVSVIFVPILKIFTEWFEPRRFAAMSGLTLLVGNTGALLASTPLAFMANCLGWRMAFLIIGIVGLLAGFLSFALVRDRPAEMNLPAPKGAGGGQNGTSFGEALNGLKSVMMNWKSWPPFFAFLGIYGTLMAFQGAWGGAYLMQNYGMTRIEAAVGILPIALGMMIGSPAVGYISDHLHRRKLPFFIAGLIYLGVWASLRFWPGGKPAPALFSALFFVMGVSASGFILSWAMGKEVNPPSLSGSAMGFTNMGGFLGAAIMQPLFGFALDSKWDGVSLGGARIYPLEGYHLTFSIGLFSIGISLLSILLAKDNAASKPQS
jgi:sugar phosphate permease